MSKIRLSLIAAVAALAIPRPPSQRTPLSAAAAWSAGMRHLGCC